MTVRAKTEYFMQHLGGNGNLGPKRSFPFLKPCAQSYNLHVSVIPSGPRNIISSFSNHQLGIRSHVNTYKNRERGEGEGEGEMKVLCNACEAAEANVMCCADEAALCWACDERVHAANKLAGKHLRVPLISSASASDSGGPGAAPSVPKCDICQESSGYFFCLEDRALLCRNCDITIHSANTFVSSHQRFLLTGVQVALESIENPNLTPNPNPSSKPPAVPLPVTSFEKSSSISGQISWESNFNNLTDTLPHTLPDWPVINAQQFSTSDLANKRSYNNMVCNSVQAGREGGGTANKIAPGGGLFSGNTPDWPLDEFFGFREYNNSGFGFAEHGSSKADSGKLGSSESSSLYRTNDEDMDVNNECLGQVPEISSWTVPEMRSPPTISGINYQKDLQFCPYDFDNLASVPDISNQWCGAGGGSRRRRY
ncbi:hypothetical protein LUZ60_009360 [Juncus effusus]|nr:hypothetical protein LUZ60_009360 [Juncus effusus]